MENSIEENIRDLIGEIGKFKPWKGKRSLPHIFSDKYSFFETCFHKQRLVILVPISDQELSPKQILRDIQVLEKKYQEIFIFSPTNLSRYCRKVLIENRIPFTTKSGDVFIPQLATKLLDMRRKEIHVDKLSTNAQYLIIFLLVNKEKLKESISLTELETQLKVSKMTISRSIKEIETLGIAETFKIGREKMISLPINYRALWEKSKQYMSSPVRSKVYLEDEKGLNKFLDAGISALSGYTSLVSDRQLTKAAKLNREDLSKFKVVDTNHTDLDFALEVWKYDPSGLSQNGLVDPYSLYLSIQNDPDERIQKCLEEMLEGYFDSRS